MRIASPRFFLLCIVTVIVVSVFSMSFYAFIARASVYNLYASTCLGGWKNTEKVVGAPDAEEGGVPQYSDYNSASISNTLAPIFCGGFKGEILHNTIQKKIVLKFSWATEEPFLEGESGATGVASSTDEGIVNVDGSANTAAVILIEEQSLLKEEEATSSESVLETEPFAEPSPIIIEDVPKQEPIVEPQPEIQPTPETPSEPPPAKEVSFIEKLFFSRVYAKENDGSAELQIATSEETKTFATTTEKTASSTEETLAPTNPEMASSTQPVISAIIPTGAILEVRYTLDGVEWKTLGYVSNISNDVSFEMPMDIFTTIADLERVQIALHTLSTFDNTPKIYLDALWLEVEYENPPEKVNGGEEQLAAVLGAGGGGAGIASITQEEANNGEEITQEGGEVAGEEGEDTSVVGNSQPDISSEEPTLPLLPPLSVRKFEKNITIDKEASHRCKAEVFRIDIAGKSSAIGKVILKKNADTPFEVEIGSLPDGIDITFSKNNDYKYNPTALENILDITIINQAGSRTGDFTVPIVFTEKGKEDSSVICQINIVNQ